MSLQLWLNNGWLTPHQTSHQEIMDLLGSGRSATLPDMTWPAVSGCIDEGAIEIIVRRLEIRYPELAASGGSNPR